MNAKNLTTGLKYSFGGITESFDFIYDQSKDNAPYQATFTDGSATRILYDSLGRKFRDSLYKNNTAFFSSTYSYLNKASDPNRTSGLVSEIDYNLSSIEDLEYSYDSRGNITGIREGGILLESYTYDKLNRLTRVDSLTQAKTIQYEYDQSGNILSKKEYPYLNTVTPTSTITYTYGAVDWKDRLTAYDGKTITYDAIGNPIYYDGNIFTWLGRRLIEYNNGSTVTSYKYNSDGIRTSKTVGSAKTEYFLNGSQILAQKTGSTVMPFYYDANGTRIAFKYNGTMYYYVYNLQGDVTHIIDSTGAIKGTYQYDAWGKILNLGSLSAIAQANPFRYRGYYYDNESGLYYLNSRYYNAEWGRFINADSAIASVGGDIRGYNLFAYCMNNPVNLTDEAGNWPKWLREAANRVVHSVKILYKTAVACINSTTASIGGGLGLGVKGSVTAKNVPVKFEAGASISDSLCWNKGEADFRNTTSVGMGFTVNEMFNTSSKYEHSHSYFDDNCNCNFIFSSYGEKSNCIANKQTFVNNATIGVSVGGYLILGVEASISIDLYALEKELLIIYNESEYIPVK